jgi:hypothetical protein
MTIQKIAQKQFDQRSYSDTDTKGRRIALDLEALAATDWQIINRVGEYDEVRSNWSRRANLANIHHYTALNS